MYPSLASGSTKQMFLAACHSGVHSKYSSVEYRLFTWRLRRINIVRIEGPLCNNNRIYRVELDEYQFFLQLYTECIEIHVRMMLPHIRKKGNERKCTKDCAQQCSCLSRLQYKILQTSKLDSQQDTLVYTNPLAPVVSNA